MTGLEETLRGTKFMKRKVTELKAGEKYRGHVGQVHTFTVARLELGTAWFKKFYGLPFCEELPCVRVINSYGGFETFKADQEVPLAA